MKFKLVAGIDQSKENFDVVILHADHPEKVEHEVFKNNRSGVKQMLSWIRSWYNVPEQEILFCAEHTGIYNLPLCITLKEMNCNLWLESALQIKLSSGLKRGKSDKADALSIARYALVQQHRVRLYELPSKNLLSLRKLLSFRERLVKQKLILEKSSKENHEFDAEESAFILKESKKLIRALEKEILLTEERMKEIITSDVQLKEKYDLINSIHGIGSQTALFLITYTNGFTLFDDWRKFACYCGIAPFEHQSGSSYKGKTRVSQMGNKKLKALLTLCALNAARGNNEMKAYYERKTSRRKKQDEHHQCFTK